MGNSIINRAVVLSPAVPERIRTSTKQCICRAGRTFLPAVIAGVIALTLPGLTGRASAAREKILDSDITLAVTEELRADEAVSSHLITVTTSNGIVTLDGTVDNILAGERATLLAKSIRGVRSVINQINTVAVDRSDDDVRIDVVRALATDPATDSYEVRVAVVDGGVTLSGTVQSWAEKKLCGTVAKSVKGVTRVVNNIDIAYAQTRTDPEIEAEVKRRLELDPYVSDEFLTVEVSGGRVELRGSVGSALEKTHAWQAGWVSGVKSVDDSNVDVKWWIRDDMKKKAKYHPKSDAELTRAINDALLWDPRASSLEISVDVDNGMVTLGGVVDNLKAKRSAEKDARNTIGVISVRNAITVVPPDLSDAEIEENVERSLTWDPFVERHQIVPVVRNKKVYLYGDVDNHYERMRAEELSSRVNGVAVVSNHLTINGRPRTTNDIAIAADVKSQLYWNWYLDEEDITVRVDDGVALLTGSVDSYYERDAAVREAFDGGAKQVECRLQVKGYPKEEPYVALRMDEYEIDKRYFF